MAVAIRIILLIFLIFSMLPLSFGAGAGQKQPVMIEVESKLINDKAESRILLRLLPQKGYFIKRDTPLEVIVHPPESLKMRKVKFGWPDVLDSGKRIKELVIPLNFLRKGDLPDKMKADLKVVACTKKSCHLIRRELSLALK